MTNMDKGSDMDKGGDMRSYRVHTRRLSTALPLSAELNPASTGPPLPHTLWYELHANTHNSFSSGQSAAYIPCTILQITQGLCHQTSQRNQFLAAILMPLVSSLFTLH